MFAGRLVLAPTADAGSPDGLAAPAKAASSRPRSDRPATPGARPVGSSPGAFTRASCSPWRKATWTVFAGRAVAGRTRYPANAGRQEQRDADTPLSRLLTCLFHANARSPVKSTQVSASRLTILARTLPQVGQRRTTPALRNT